MWGKHWVWLKKRIRLKFETGERLYHILCREMQVEITGEFC